MSAIPEWALSYLTRHLPGTAVLNGRALGRNRVLANTRQGAVLVTRSWLGGVRHALVEVAQDRIAMRCKGCGHNLQFYNLELPATVYCSICAAKYHVDAAGAVQDATGNTVEASAGGEGRLAMCACCADGCCEGGSCCDHAECGKCCEQTGCCKEGCDPRTCCPVEACQCCQAAQEPGGSDAGRPRSHKDSGDGQEAVASPPEARSEPTQLVVPPAEARPAFTHNGYTLYKRDVETKSGSRPLYFFSKGQPKAGQAIPLPEGHEVGVNDRTGLPFLRRHAGTPASVTLMGFKGDNHPVLDVEGIGPTWSEKLHACGVNTTDELCRSDPQALAQRMGEAVETIRFWQGMAELMKVKGIGPQYAEAMTRAGVHGIEALKARKAADIVTSTNEWLDAQKQTVIKTRLTAARVQTWQKAAKAMRRVKLPPHTLS